MSATEKAAAFMELIFDTNKQMSKSFHTKAGGDECYGKNRSELGKGSDLLYIRNDS